MKNRILLLVNYNGNKSRANYTQRMSGKLKKKCSSKLSKLFLPISV
jgi:hypothetical protein